MGNASQYTHFTHKKKMKDVSQIIYHEEQNAKLSQQIGFEIVKSVAYCQSLCCSWGFDSGRELTMVHTYVQSSREFSNQKFANQSGHENRVSKKKYYARETVIPADPKSNLQQVRKGVTYSAGPMTNASEKYARIV